VEAEGLEWLANHNRMVTTEQARERMNTMGIFKRRYPDGRESTDWYIDYRINGKRFKRRIGPNKKLAEQVLMDIEVKRVKGEYLGVHETKKIAFPDFLKEYLQWAQVNKGTKTYALNCFCADRLRESFIGNLAGLTAKQVEDYKVKRRATVAPATVNRELAVLKHLCTKAIEWGYLKANPLRSVKCLKEPPGRLRYLVRDEIEVFLAACSPHLRPIVMVALHAGMRKSEILALEWRDIDFVARIITVRLTKNNDHKIIPLNQSLYEELQQLARHLHSPYVFCNAEGKRYDEVKRSFHTACRKAGITDFRFHDLRHTFASHLIMNGINLKTVQHLLGHKDIRMTLRYAHLSKEHLQAAVGTLDRNFEVGTKREQRISG
jgi:integrase